jgi:DNA-binding CsgD family transcriptional regulator
MILLGMTHDDLLDPDPLAASRRRFATELQQRYALERRQVAYIAYRDAGDDLRFVELDREQHRELVIGRAAELDIPLSWDPAVSNVHATLKLVGTVWVLDDVGSLNGTFVNERRIVDSYKLVDKDLVRAGETYIAYRAAIRAGHPAAIRPTATRSSTRLPAKTVVGDRKLVLIELCRPLLVADGLPASTPTNAEISVKLHMAKGTVASHLRKIAALLGVHDRHGVQREVIAREAIRLRLVSPRDL